MKSSLDSRIRVKLHSLLSGRISIEQFEHWFAPLVWEMLQNHYYHQEPLACEIEHYLVEHSSGYLQENELKRRLRSSLGNYAFVVDEKPHTTSSKSNSEIKVLDLEIALT